MQIRFTDWTCTNGDALAGMPWQRIFAGDVGGDALATHLHCADALAMCGRFSGSLWP